jgi:hypothetical protein
VRSSDQIRVAVFADRAEFFGEFSAPCFGVNCHDARVSPVLRDFFWLQAMRARLQSICGRAPRHLLDARRQSKRRPPTVHYRVGSGAD